MPDIRLAASDRVIPCDDGDTVLRAALRAGVGMSYSCNTGACGNCRFELVEGEVVHLRADAPAWSDRDRARNRWLGCQAAPKGDCTVKFREDPAAVRNIRPARRKATLVSRTDLSHDFAEFAFRIEGDDAFLPGQYALITLPGVDGPRVYSMSNLPGEDGIWRFQIRHVPGGAATGALFGGMAPGTAVEMDGPYGLAHLRPDAPRDLVLVAGGSGLSPMASIARGALAAPNLAGRSIRVYFGGRSPEDTRVAGFLAGLAPGRLTLVTAVSDPARTEGWSGPTGFVHEVLDAEMGEGLKDLEIYFAGPPAMAVAMQKALHARGVPQEQVHFDEFY